MRFLLAASAVTAAIASTGCATISSDKSQAVIVRTTCGDEPVTGASCKITNPRGNWTIQSTPGAAMISRTPGAMVVECRMATAVADPVLFESHASLGAYGNLLGFGIVGWTYDAYNKAAWSYHPEMTIDVCRGQPAKSVAQIQGAQVTSTSNAQAETPPLAGMRSTLPTGELRYAIAAEAVAKSRQCSAAPSPVLSARGPATEVYTVGCSNGDALMLKCTWGECKAI